MSQHDSATGLVANASKPQSQKTRSLAPSNISLFVSNLCLLDLDQRPDWPDITVRTFDTKDALQNQKKRISCVEWALYRLFELWDREITRDKLQPFFPPLEPLQSLNLRSALFRCLNDLKKNDVLGREAAVRKTMLDECKGEKFEEVLLLFSAAVVRKRVLAARHKQPVSIGRRMATAQVLTKDDLNSFVPLALAYRVSLTKTLRDRAEYVSALQSFREVMHQRRQGYRDSSVDDSSNRALSKSSLSPETIASIEREVRSNWIGNTNGLDTLVDGTKAIAPDAMIDGDFDSLWRHFRQGTAPSAASGDVSLLETLQTRVTQQNRRLHQWKEHRNQLDAPHGEGLPVRAPEKPVDQHSLENHGLNLFNRHQDIRVDQGRPQDTESPVSVTSVHYEDVLTRMNDGLARVRKEKQERRNTSAARSKASNVGRASNAPSARVPVPVFLAGSNQFKNDLFSPLKRPPRGSEDSSPIVQGNGRRQWGMDTPQTVNENKIRPLENFHIQKDHASSISSTPSPKFVEDQVQAAGSISSLENNIARMHLDGQPDNPRFLDEEMQNSDLPSVTPSTRGADTPASKNQPFKFPPTPTLPSSPEEAFDPPSINTLGKSPVVSSSHEQTPNTKPLPLVRSSTVSETQRRPTLAERTRMSMAFTSSDSIPQLPPNESPPQPQEQSFSPLPSITSNPTPQETPISLADRARQSILANQAAAAIPRSRPTTRPRPQSTFYPTNPFTPQKPKRNSLTAVDTLDMETTPKDRLFSEDAEYASVFKSRPKVAHSPIFSPAEEGGSFIGVGDDVDDFTMLESSPLRGR